MAALWARGSMVHPSPRILHHSIFQFHYNVSYTKKWIIAEKKSIDSAILAHLNISKYILVIFLKEKIKITKIIIYTPSFYRFWPPESNETIHLTLKIVLDLLRSPNGHLLVNLSYNFRLTHYFGILEITVLLFVYILGYKFNSSFKKWYSF